MFITLVSQLHLLLVSSQSNMTFSPPPKASKNSDLFINLFSSPQYFGRRNNLLLDTKNSEYLATLGYTEFHKLPRVGL